MKTLVIISSKSPNPYLLTTIQTLYEGQFKGKSTNDFKIVVVDSCSDDLCEYLKVKQQYPEVAIMLTNNANYEFGAYKQAYTLYDDYDIYMCIQDNMIFDGESIDLLQIANVGVGVMASCRNGFKSHLVIKERAEEMLRCMDTIPYEHIINVDFEICVSNLIIATNSIMKGMFNTLTILPVNKRESCIYERLLSIYFISKEIKTICVSDKLTKINQQRF
jgi:hypothetical protein